MSKLPVHYYISGLAAFIATLLVMFDVTIIKALNAVIVYSLFYWGNKLYAYYFREPTDQQNRRKADFKFRVFQGARRDFPKH